MTRLHRRTGWRALAATAVAAIAMSLVPAAADAAIGQPGALAPNDGSGALLKNLELGWAGVQGASSYDVQIAEDESFEGVVLGSSTSTTHFSVPVSLPRGGYVWHVRAVTANGPGPWSGVAQFTRGWDRSLAPGNPHLVSSAGPAAAGSFVALPAYENPAFTWEPLADTSFYEVEVSSIPFTSSAPVYSGTQDQYRLTCYTQHTWFAPYGVVSGKSDGPGDESKCTFGLSDSAVPEDGSIGTQLHPGALYYWRVRGRDGTKSTAATPFADPSLSCTGVWNTTGAKVSGGKVSVVIPTTPPAYLAKPECSQWADGGTFSVDMTGGANVIAQAPGALAAWPTAGDPAAAQVALTGTPLLSWGKVSGAVFYRLFLSRTRDFTDSDFVFETSATSFSPVGSFADRSVPTYWTVQACGWLQCSNAAPVRAYTKAGRNTVSVLGAGSSGSETTLTWSTQFPVTKPGASPVPADDQPASYQVQVSQSGDWSKPLVDVTVDHLGNDPAATYLRVPTASLPSRYVWRVRAVDEIGRAWGWAYSAPFGRITTAAGFGLRSPLAVAFTEPVVGVAAGAAILDPAGRAINGSWENKSATDWTFTPSSAWMAGQSYHLSLDGVRDRSGRAVRLFPGSVRAALVVDSGSAQLKRSAGDVGWRSVSASDARGKSFLRSSDRPSTSRTSRVWVDVKGTGVTVAACKSPRSGDAYLVVDGTRVATLHLYRKYSGCETVYKGGMRLANNVHTVAVVASGHKARKSKGYDISVDAIGVR